jgi:hypothetical protein
MPADSKEYMATELGNIIRTAETTPRHILGLDAVACWLHIWPLLPDALRQGLSGIR